MGATIGGVPHNLNVWMLVLLRLRLMIVLPFMDIPTWATHIFRPLQIVLVSWLPGIQCFWLMVTNRQDKTRFLGFQFPRSSLLFSHCQGPFGTYRSPLYGFWPIDLQSTNNVISPNPVDYASRRVCYLQIISTIILLVITLLIITRILDMAALLKPPWDLLFIFFMALETENLSARFTELSSTAASVVPFSGSSFAKISWITRGEQNLTISLDVATVWNIPRVIWSPNPSLISKQWTLTVFPATHHSQGRNLHYRACRHQIASPARVVERPSKGAGFSDDGGAPGPRHSMVLVDLHFCWVVLWVNGS